MSRTLRALRTFVRATITSITFTVLPVGAASAQMLTNLNAPGTPGGGTTFGFQSKAVGLTIGPDAFSFTSMRATLYAQPFAGTGGQVTGGIYSSVGGNPGTLLGAFNTVAVPDASPLFLATFTTAAPFALSANTSFWFLLSGTNAPFVAWAANAPQLAPTAAPGVIYDGYRISSDGGLTYRSSAVLNRVEINGVSSASVVPEPEAYALLATGLAGVAGVARARRRRV